MDARRRHQGGEAVEQFQRRQRQRAVSTRTGFVAVVEQALGIELAQPVRTARGQSRGRGREVFWTQRYQASANSV